MLPLRSLEQDRNVNVDTGNRDFHSKLEFFAFLMNFGTERRIGLVS